MTNEELKKKICDVLQDSIEYELQYYPDDNYTEVEFDYEKTADALIAAGYGDVKEVEHRAKVLGRTLAIMVEKGLISGVVDDYIVQAEKELAEEGKE